MSGAEREPAPRPGGLPRLRLRETTLFDAIANQAEGSIREAVIEQLKKAGAAGAKAADIRREIEKKLGRTLHEKTIGMTLYRLSLKGQSKRDGLIWIHVPDST